MLTKDETGYIHAIATPLSKERLNTIYLSTYSSDIILVLFLFEFSCFSSSLNT